MRDETLEGEPERKETRRELSRGGGGKERTREDGAAEREKKETEERGGRSISGPYLPRPGPLFRAQTHESRRRCLSPPPPRFHPLAARSVAVPPLAKKRV